MNNLESLVPYVSSKQLSAFTFEEWLSVTTARTLNPTLERHDIHSEIYCANHSPVIFVSGKALMTNEIDFFKPCIINATTPLY